MGNKGTICVIVPAKDEALVIRSTLESLLEAGMSPEDIYVIDDGSSDETGEIAHALGVQVLRNEVNIGKAQSVERVVGQFELTDRYEYIALMDADTRVNDQYFIEVQNAFLDERVAVVCGQPKSRPHNWLTAYRSLGYFLADVIYRKGQSNMGVINVAPGCTTSYRAEVFRQLEWSDDTIVEDMDVTVQVHRKQLGRIVYQPKAIVYTQDPATLSDYLRQVNRWNSGAWQVVRKYDMLRGRKKIDWEYKLLMGEGLIFAIISLALPIIAVLFAILSLLLPRFESLFPTLWIGLMLEPVFLVAISLAAAINNRRYDVALFSPLYLFPQYIDRFMFIRCFWVAYVRKRYKNNWNSVARYSAS